MSKDLVPFGEKSYQEYDTPAFSNAPNTTITEFEHLLSNQSKVSDAGCGEGQNAIYLALQGHLVDAFDLSEHGIAKLKYRCGLSNAQVNAFAADLTTYQFEQYYDMIICFGTLHFVAKNEWKKFIKNAKEHPNVPKHLHASNKIAARRVK